ncbi:MAG: prepilin-type N-terminal cleavage/methylation domain-containing protein [Elusimicrobia bacterium]|nr:prepilin-type N-terminal cleavage/methylation domain-containing protein [Elusimicrobiota bacterium]
MKKTKKKEAFTLTELLVVVIVIGVLAAIVLPKFSKVMETRKTTEAEELMAAVRTEQERRCALDKPYATEFTQMRDLVASSQATKYTTKNYVYELGNTGMQALSTGKYGYTLQMPSYRDGRLCCKEAQQCANLNKDYPTCEQLQARADYQDGTECAGDGAQEPSECVDGATRGSTPCNGCGTQTTQLCVNGTWTEQLGACSKTASECQHDVIGCFKPDVKVTFTCSDGTEKEAIKTWNTKTCEYNLPKDPCREDSQKETKKCLFKASQVGTPQKTTRALEGGCGGKLTCDSGTENLEFQKCYPDLREGSWLWEAGYRHAPCEFGKECSACEEGLKYVGTAKCHSCVVSSSNGVPEECRQMYVIKYATCGTTGKNGSCNVDSGFASITSW